MLIVFTALGVYLVARATIAAVQSLRNLPRSNEDWVYF